ncbi:ABC transporter ATP-binding protein [Embleya sp. AB8]|uniref:ABC transporter ATP-binding protein n=1 Tax=Embleya sp. AB8 TaxID=3156304 RepID=UPI003C7674D6
MPEQSTPQQPQQGRDEIPPTVVVDDVHLIYRVHGGAAGKGSATSALSRLALRKKAAGVNEVHAVRGVSFVAYKGEAVGLIGRNGSGKSTLLRCIAGLLPPTTGKIYSDGQPSLLGVNAAMMNDLTGERNIILGCLAMGMTQREADANYDQIATFSGLNNYNGKDFLKLPMRTYSSGMAARLRFSIAAARTHDVLMIDEALATGDRDFQLKSEARIRKLREEAGTVFLVSHGMKSIRDTCDRVIWLDQGVIKMDGPTDEVVNAYEGK